MKALFDTNILVDYLLGVPQAKAELKKYREVAISIITWMEVLVGVTADEDLLPIKAFLARFTLIEISQAIAEDAVQIRKSHKLKLPDAIILASARDYGSILVTRNTKDFSAKDPSVRIPYRRS